MNLAEVSARTGIPVRELNRLNSDVWYHGTSEEGADSLQKLGVIALYNRGNMLDFGAGYYLTDTKERADSYISRVPLIGADYRPVKRKNWVVMDYRSNPYKILFGDPATTSTDDMSMLDRPGYVFRNFPKHNEEFAKFAFDNRLNNVNNEKPHGIDIIWGVMSDNFPDQIVYDFLAGRLSYEKAIEKLQKPNSMKQLYIGNQGLCDMFELKNMYVGRAED